MRSRRLPAQAASGEVSAKWAEGRAACPRRDERRLDAFLHSRRVRGKLRRAEGHQRGGDASPNPRRARRRCPRCLRSGEHTREQGCSETADRGGCVARAVRSAPFNIGDELFWGNDRLEAALAWAKEP